MVIGLQILLVYTLSMIIAGIEYMIYVAGSGYYGEDRHLVLRKAVAWGLRIAMSIGFASLFTDPISTNEFWLYVFGYHLLSSLPTQGTYYQFKRWFGNEKLFWFFSHSRNGLIWKGKYYFTSDKKDLRFPILDLYAFLRILAGVFGFIMLTVEHF
jgi:hypothetical protein